MAQKPVKAGSSRAENPSVETYKGSLKVTSTADVVDAVFDIGNETLRVIAADQELGTWSLADVGVQHRGDGLHLDLGGESIIVNVPNQEALADAIEDGKPKQKPKRSRRKQGKSQQRPEGAHIKSRRPRPRPPTVKAASRPANVEFDDFDELPKAERVGWKERLPSFGEIIDRDSWEAWLSDNTIRWSIASVGVIAFALMALFATNTLGMILVLLGMVALIIAALAVSEDLSAYRVIPSAISESVLVVAGAVMMGVGALLIVLS